MPYIIVVVALSESVKLVRHLVDRPPEQVRIAMPETLGRNYTGSFQTERALTAARIETGLAERYTRDC